MKTDAISTELNRITVIEQIDTEKWDKLYKVCTPLIKRLSRNIDSRRLNMSVDLIESYFWDKFLYIFNKYQNVQEYEHLKATMLSGIKKYSYRLMRDCYTKQSEFYQSHISLEVLFDDDKEDFIDEAEPDNKHEMWDSLIEYLKNNLTEDEFVLWEVLFNPPPFLKEKMEESRGKLSILHLIDFFEFPRNKRSYHYFNIMRSKIKLTLKEASANFGGLIPNSTLASNLSE